MRPEWYLQYSKPCKHNYWKSMLGTALWVGRVNRHDKLHSRCSTTPAFQSVPASLRASDSERSILISKSQKISQMDAVDLVASKWRHDIVAVKWTCTAVYRSQIKEVLYTPPLHHILAIITAFKNPLKHKKSETDPNHDNLLGHVCEWQVTWTHVALGSGLARSNV